jgi:hypothetical protein
MVRTDKLEKIEDEIRSLSAEELAKLRDWLFEFDAAAWDSQIEADASSGKLDALADAALESHRRKQTTEL